MDEMNVVQLGAAGVAVGVILYVFRLLVDGTLHTNSEIHAKDKQIADLLDANHRLTDALEQSNTTLQNLINAGTSHAPSNR